jgi:hypothetical protein
MGWGGRGRHGHIDWSTHEQDVDDDVRQEGIEVRPNHRAQHLRDARRSELLLLMLLTHDSPSCHMRHDNQVGGKQGSQEDQLQDAKAGAVSGM